MKSRVETFLKLISLVSTLFLAGVLVYVILRNI